MKTIEIIIDPRGQTRIQSKGFTGSACKAATAPLERALGLVQSDTPTAEMHQPQSTQQQPTQAEQR